MDHGNGDELVVEEAGEDWEDGVGAMVIMGSQYANDLFLGGCLSIVLFVLSSWAEGMELLYFLRLEIPQKTKFPSINQKDVLLNRFRFEVIDTVGYGKAGWLGQLRIP